MQIKTKILIKQTILIFSATAICFIFGIWPNGDIVDVGLFLFSPIGFIFFSIFTIFTIIYFIRKDDYIKLNKTFRISTWLLIALIIFIGLYSNFYARYPETFIERISLSFKMFFYYDYIVDWEYGLLPSVKNFVTPYLVIVALLILGIKNNKKLDKQ